MPNTEEGRAAARELVASRMLPPLDTVTALSRAAGVDFGTVSDFLNGNRWPQRRKQLRIEEALGLPTGAIERTANGDATEVDAENVGAVDQDAGVLLSLPQGAFDGLTDADREEAIAAAKAALLERAREIRRRLDQ